VTQRSTFWLSTWTLFTLANAAGMGWAIARSEAGHAALHAGLMIVGAFAAWFVDARASRGSAKFLPPADERLTQLQQSVDAVALEVERLGEAQRYGAKQAVERQELRRPE
jgi:hypothetical protein